MCPTSKCTCYYVHTIPCEVKTTTTTTTQCVEPCNCCSHLNEKYLDKLKKSNTELKGLIKKLDNLTDSMISTADECCTSTCCSSAPNTREIVITEHVYDDSCCKNVKKIPISTSLDCCGLCKDSSKKSHTIKCEYALCDKCEKMLRMSELDRERKSRSRSRSRSDSKSYDYCRCSSCERGRSRSRSKSKHDSRTCRVCKLEKERSRSRSRSLSRPSWYYSYRSRSASNSSRCSIDEGLQRPIWNGGPYVSYYNWRDYKLKEEKK